MIAALLGPVSGPLVCGVLAMAVAYLVLTIVGRLTDRRRP